MSDEKTCNCPTKSDENLFELSEEDLEQVSGGGSGEEVPVTYCHDCKDIVERVKTANGDKCQKCGGGNIEYFGE